MKVCPGCNTTHDDGVAFCTNCGFSFAAQPASAPAPVADPADHTAEYDPADISENKIFAMIPYLVGWIGIVIALLVSNNSKFVSFHVKQALKFAIVESLLGIATALLCWTFIVPIVGAILIVVLTVLELICFFQVCSGKAKEAPIIKDLAFLK